MPDQSNYNTMSSGASFTPTSDDELDCSEICCKCGDCEWSAGTVGALSFLTVLAIIIAVVMITRNTICFADADPYNEHDHDQRTLTCDTPDITLNGHTGFQFLIGSACQDFNCTSSYIPATCNVKLDDCNVTVNFNPATKAEPGLLILAAMVVAFYSSQRRNGLSLFESITDSLSNRLSTTPSL